MYRVSKVKKGGSYDYDGVVETSIVLGKYKTLQEAKGKLMSLIGCGFQAKDLIITKEINFTIEINLIVEKEEI